MSVSAGCGSITAGAVTSTMIHPAAGKTYVSLHAPFKTQLFVSNPLFVLSLV